MKWITTAMLVIAGACVSQAQVDVTTEQNANKTASSAQVSVNTGDHTFVPLTVESKKTTVNDSATVTVSTTKALLGRLLVATTGALGEIGNQEGVGRRHGTHQRCC